MSYREDAVDDYYEQARDERLDEELTNKTKTAGANPAA